MKPKRIAALVAPLFVFGMTQAVGHDDDAAIKGRLGTVLFKTSCTAQAQKDFERALAMLHSFTFPETIKAFTGVTQTDPACAIGPTMIFKSSVV